jgi:hypothetical protein
MGAISGTHACIADARKWLQKVERRAVICGFLRLVCLIIGSE